MKQRHYFKTPKHSLQLNSNTNSFHLIYFYSSLFKAKDPFGIILCF